MPLDFAGVEAKVFRKCKRFGIPALNVAGEFDQDVAILLKRLEAGHAVDHAEDLLGIELGTALRFIKQVKGDCGQRCRGQCISIAR